MLSEISTSFCIVLNGVSIMILSVVLYRVQKELREIRYQNMMIENEKRVLDRLSNFRYPNSYSSIDLGEMDE